MGEPAHTNLPKVHHLQVHTQDGEKNMSVNDFHKIDIVERTQMVYEGRVHFYDAMDHQIPSHQAMESLRHLTPPWQPPQETA